MTKCVWAQSHTTETQIKTYYEKNGMGLWFRIGFCSHSIYRWISCNTTTKYLLWTQWLNFVLHCKRWSMSNLKFINQYQKKKRKRNWNSTYTNDIEQEVAWAAWTAAARITVAWWTTKSKAQESINQTKIWQRSTIDSNLTAQQE